jgi:hypothetical protein
VTGPSCPRIISPSRNSDALTQPRSSVYSLCQPVTPKCVDAAGGVLQAQGEHEVVQVADRGQDDPAGAAIDPRRLAD